MSFDEDLADQIGDLQRKFGNKTVTGETGIMKKTSRQSGQIDSQFDLDLDDDNDRLNSDDKYGSDLDISSDEDDNGSDESQDYVSSLNDKGRSAVPHSMPINVNFGVDPLTKRPRSPHRADKEEKEDKIPHGSIYENMVELSRSIQPADYRNRVLGTRPEDAGVSMSYSLYSQPVQKPRAIVCNEPAECLDTSGTPKI